MGFSTIGKYFEKGIDFWKGIRYNIKADEIRRGILIGKEPHWKCGVPQGIVRSSRILSARVSPNTNCIRTLCILSDNYAKMRNIYTISQ